MVVSPQDARGFSGKFLIPSRFNIFAISFAEPCSKSTTTIISPIPSPGPCKILKYILIHWPSYTGFNDLAENLISQGTAHGIAHKMETYFK